MKYYLHRISHHAELAYPLLERGILSIGWSDFATREFVSSHRAKGWKDVPTAIDSEPGWKICGPGLAFSGSCRWMWATGSSSRVGGPSTYLMSCRMND